MKRFILFFYLLYWYYYIVFFFVPQLPSLEFGLRGGRGGGAGIASSSFKKKKKIVLGRNRTHGFNLLAKCSRASRGDSFTRQVSIPMESESWLACAC